MKYRPYFTMKVSYGWSVVKFDPDSETVTHIVTASRRSDARRVAGNLNAALRERKT
jgi:hypothetical protein